MLSFFDSAVMGVFAGAGTARGDFLSGLVLIFIGEPDDDADLIRGEPAEVRPSGEGGIDVRDVGHGLLPFG